MPFTGSKISNIMAKQAPAEPPVENLQGEEVQGEEGEESDVYDDIEVGLQYFTCIYAS